MTPDTWPDSYADADVTLENAAIKYKHVLSVITLLYDAILNWNSFINYIELDLAIKFIDILLLCHWSMIKGDIISYYS